MYLNKDEKELMISVMACRSVLEVAVSRGKPFSKSRKRLKTALTHISKAVDELAEELDADALRGMYNIADNSYMSFSPKSSGATSKELTVALKSDLDILTRESLSDCGFCMKEGREAKKCEKRKALLRCGIDVRTDGDCPYRVI